MKQIKKVLREVEISLRRLITFVILLKTLVLLMVTYMLLYMIGIKPFYAFIPAFVYFVSSIFVQTRIDNIKRLEQKYKELNERLITARDYQNEDNTILDTLEEEIVENLKHVKLSTFFSLNKTILLILLLMIAVSSSLYVASKDLKIIDINDVVEAAVKGFTSTENGTAQKVDFTGSEESIMQVGNERVEVEINPVGIDFDFSDVTEEAKYDFSTSFPAEVFISSAAAYENEFTEEQQALIKRYFDKKKGR